MPTQFTIPTRNELRAVCRRLRSHAARLRKLGERDRAQSDDLLKMAASADAAADALECPPLRAESDA